MKYARRIQVFKAGCLIYREEKCGKPKPEEYEYKSLNLNQENSCYFSKAIKKTKWQRDT